MAYRIIISPRAQKEIENAIDYYALYSTDAPEVFITLLKETYTTLQSNPFFKVCYKDVRSLKIKRFPYSLYFIINENKHTVRVLSCFHNKRNPHKRPRYE
ncbi:MAG TPA: type II toxin-antitoxin system RelE/ParE family toxin [Porphyromonadaceae bacterium]|nr:type II toxin-antitoxin system RelE/ParE family toxin [Porphyromonadaceae bacterium]HBK33356.1 type II toxin-antitoxin system RelE/ParE family toxin [Porphyromonadaceae bacterium]HBL34536.1 type II toxin-antitoxin system RelE/ParE family toxin [Porphyromonadaceae bacterium]HBX21643.1 type II toxin-antitoxin system RelE/ParE family toxin [Porphyromonadaceae bacterium]HCM19698.1 type II toxin-antitoxin system RelE/ParE family toxin [Porphyromonadaceae bacterium]